jgi:prepilin-type N-terminal cleavage/methylation domain-containing protein
MLSALYRMRIRQLSRRMRDEAGFTMVEMVIAIFIFGLVIGGVAVGMSSSLNLTRQNRNRSIAANLASQEMDTVRSTKFTSLIPGAVTTAQSVDGVPYTIERDTEWVTPNATSGPCQAPSGSTLAYYSVTVSVTWNNMAGVPAVVSHTVVTPPVGTYDRNTGHVAVTIRDAAGMPQENVPVTLTGPGVSTTQTTTTDGCAFFAYEPAGSYTVTLSKSGYVDDQGNAGPSQIATVQAGSTVPLEFQYDGGSTLAVTLTGSAGGAIPTNVPVSIGNTHLQPAGTKTYAGSGNPRTITGVFPYTDGYDVWAGDCTAADPEGLDTSGGALYPGASRQTTLAVTAGSTSSGTVTLHSLKIQTRTTLGDARAGVTITATNEVDAGCPTTTVYTLGTTNGSGNLTAALPYGTWTLAASGTGTTKSKALSPLVATTPTVTFSW